MYSNKVSLLASSIFRRCESCHQVIKREHAIMNIICKCGFMALLYTLLYTINHLFCDIKIKLALITALSLYDIIQST